MGCNTEAATPAQPLHKRGQHGGGRHLWQRFTLIYYIFMTFLILKHGPRNRSYNCLSCRLSCFDEGSGSCRLSCFDEGSGSSAVASGGVGGVLASFNIMVKESCGSSFLIMPPWHIVTRTGDTSWTHLNFSYLTTDFFLSLSLEAYLTLHVL